MARAQGDALGYRLVGNAGDGGPHAVARAGGVGIAPSSFGLDATTLGPQYGADGIWNSQRKAELLFRQRYYRCQSHDLKNYDFNGNLIGKGGARQSVTQGFISQSANSPDYYVPLSARRPSVPYRLARKIVGAFTGLLFGHGRWPQMRSDDPDTQAWAEAIVAAGKLQVRMTQARNLGGSCGAVGISWKWAEGKPRFKVHDAAFLHVVEWADEDERIPAHVTQLEQREHEVEDPKTKKLKRVPFWYRQDWTPVADVVFRPVEVTDEEPDWASLVDEERSEAHGHGRCHFAWIQNLPADDLESEDGQPDYAEAYEPLDSLDMLNSVLHKGTVLNLDPTLVVKANPEEVEIGGGMIIKKGSDNAIVPGESGDAKYLEISGSSVDAGIKLVEKERDQILETTECVLVDPDKAAASGQSSVALKIIYAPMIAKTDLLRGAYGGAIERLVNDVTDYARRHLPDEPGQRVVEDVPVMNDNGEPIEGEDGVPVYEERDVEFFVDLPARVVTKPRLDEQGKPVTEEDGTPVVDEEQVPTLPGAGDVTLEWGEYFKPTADDLQKSTAAISQAAGGKPVMSQRAAVELNANNFNRDPNQEWVDVQREVAAERAHEAAVQAGMFPKLDASGGFGDTLSFEAEQKKADSEQMQTLTVREVRAAMGLPPLVDESGAESPDNDLTFAEFLAKAAARGTAEGTGEGGGAPPVPVPTDPEEKNPGSFPAPAQGDDEPPEPTPFAPAG